MENPDTAERPLPHNPGRLEARLRCLEMATKTALLSGRGGGITELAQTYYDWCMLPGGDEIEPLGASQRRAGGSSASARQAAGGNKD